MTVCAHLTHEVRDDPVEAGSAVTEALLSCTQSPEVLCCFGQDVSKELHDDSPSILTIYGDVEEDHRVGLLRKRLGGRHLNGVILQQAALAAGEHWSEGLGQLCSLEPGCQLLNFPVSLCMCKQPYRREDTGSRVCCSSSVADLFCQDQIH